MHDEATPSGREVRVLSVRVAVAPDEFGAFARSEWASPLPEDSVDDRPHRTVVFVVDGPLAPADVPGLCRRVRALMDQPGGTQVVCDVGALVVPDGVAVDALARLQLAARRRGCRVALRHAPAELLELLALAGLTEIVPLENWDDDGGGWRCEV